MTDRNKWHWLRRGHKTGSWLLPTMCFVCLGFTGPSQAQVGDRNLEPLTKLALENEKKADISQMNVTYETRVLEFC